MIIYNLTKVHRGTNYVSEPLEILVWAMDDGGKPPFTVCADVGGKLFPLKRLFHHRVEDSPAQLEEVDAPLPPAKEISVQIEIKLDGRVIQQQRVPYFLEGQTLKSASEMGNYPVAHSDGGEPEYLGPPPEGLDPQFLYFLRLELRPGKARVRIVAIDNDRRKHWVHGFWVCRTGVEKLIAQPVQLTASRKSFAHKISDRWATIYSKFLKLPQWVVKTTLVWLLAQKKYADRWSFVTLINPERLGHFVANTEIYLAEKRCGLHLFPETQPVFFISRHAFVEDHGLVDVRWKVANNALYGLWKQKYKIVKEGLISNKMLDQFRQSFPATVHRHRAHGHRDIHGCLDRTPPSVELTENQISQGNAFLSAHGIPTDAKIVLFHYRTPEFVGSTYKNIGASLEADRYQYRNTDANSYELALDWLLSRGYYVIRMGQEKTPWNFIHPHALDFASLRKKDWMDLYLFSRCDFFVGGTSGIYTLAELFRKPILFTNFAPIGHVYSSSKRYFSIFKMLMDRKTESPVPLQEQLATDLGWTVHGEKIDWERFYYRDNTAAEILDATMEMTLRQEGKWEDPEENETFQAQFWSHFTVNEYHCHFAGRVGSKFLKENSRFIAS